MNDYGIDISKVAVPVTGGLGFAPDDTANFVAPEDGGKVGFKVPVAFRQPGLLTEDGGFEWTTEADGDPIAFWQSGYQIPSGAAKATLVVTLAQTDALVNEIVRGEVADENGYIKIDAGGTSKQYIVFTEEVFRNGRIRRRQARVSVQGVKESKSERGKVIGYEVTFGLLNSPELDNKHLGEWLVDPANLSKAPTVTAATPSDAKSGATVTINGTGFTGATQVAFGSANATSFTVTNANEIKAVVPDGSAGSAVIKVTGPAGVSQPFPYQRG